MLPKTWKEIVQVQLYIFWMIPSHPHQLRKYIIDGPFLNEKTYKGIRISYSLKYKHSKK